MKNYKGEHYPLNISELTQKAFNLSNEMIERLNDPNCPKILELYRHKESSIYTIKANYNKFWGEPNSQVGKSKSLNEYKGVYVMGEIKESKISPTYIGISRTICRRLKQHGWGKKHNECSLAYLQTRDENPNVDRKNIKGDSMEIAKNQIRNYKVWLVPIESDYEMYFLEVALAGILRTKWNSFRTH